MKIKGKKSISSRTKASHGKSKATKSKLAPKSKPLKKVHQKSYDPLLLLAIINLFSFSFFISITG
jgi:hypothetical protein